MFKIDGTNITLTRGDTLIAEVKATVKSTGEDYIPTAQDHVRFAMKRNQMDAGRKRFIDEEPLLEVSVPTDTMILRIEADATKEFDFGQYWYDIEITFEDGTVDTFIEGILTLTKEAD